MINGASDFLAAALGPEVGPHARAAVGVCGGSMEGDGESEFC